MPEKLRYAIYQGRFEHPEERSKALLVIRVRSLNIARATMIGWFDKKKGDFFIVDLRVKAVVGAAWCLTQELIQ